MKSSSPSMRARIAICLALSLSACATPSVPTTPPEPLRPTPPECLKLCPLTPELTGATEPEFWRWADEMRATYRECAAIPDACAAEMLTW